MKQTLSLILALVLVVGILAGCGNAAPAEPEEKPAATEAPAAAEQQAAEPVEIV